MSYIYYLIPKRVGEPTHTIHPDKILKVQVTMNEALRLAQVYEIELNDGKSSTEILERAKNNPTDSNVAAFRESWTVLPVTLSSAKDKQGFREWECNR